jgi:hypothetical protein
MNTLRNELKEKYSQIPNELITDLSLCHGSLRVLLYLFTKPDNWNVYNLDICKQLDISEQTLTKYWKKLLSSKWLIREQSRNDKGHLTGGYTYRIGNFTVSIQSTESVKSIDYSNNKLINKKETNKPISLLEEYLKEDTTITDQGIEIVKEFIDYRKKIKSPIKTIQPIKAYMKVLRELIHKGYDYKEVIDLQKEREWQTVKSEWVEKSLKPKGKSDVFASSRNVGGYTA